MTTTKKTSPYIYGSGMFGTSLPINMFRNFAITFYNLHLGLPLTKISLIMLIYTFIDVIDNPIYGILSDKTNTRFGRRKPWLLIASPLFAVFFVLFYAPPAGLGMGGLFAWALIFYCITGTLDSMICANYGALLPELFPDEVSRTKANAVKQVCQLIAMVVAIALTPMIAKALSSTGNKGYTVTAIIYAVIATAVIVFMTFGVHEPERLETDEEVRLLPALKALIRQKNFWLVGIGNAFYSAAMSLVMATIGIFITFALKLDDSNSTYLLGTVILVALIGVLIWSQLIKKLGAVKVWRIAFIVLTITFIPLYFAYNLITAIIFAAFVGVGFAGVISTMDLIGSKIVDEDYARHGVKRAGVVSSIGGFLNRLSGLFVSLGTLLASVIYKYVSGDEPGPRPDDAARFLLVIFPFALMLFAVAASFLVKFDKKSVIEYAEGGETSDGSTPNDIEF